MPFWNAARVAGFAAVVVVAAFASGCSPKIGDKCTISTDCSVNGDRLCDTTQPDGYCTVFNCQPNTCPDEAACVAFGDDACGVGLSARASRFRRTFCMFVCESDADCRAGYTCQDLGSQIVDSDPPNRQVCAVAASGSQVPPASTPPICSQLDASASATSGGDASGTTGTTGTSSTTGTTSTTGSADSAVSNESSTDDAALPDTGEASSSTEAGLSTEAGSGEASPTNGD